MSGTTNADVWTRTQSPSSVDVLSPDYEPEPVDQVDDDGYVETIVPILGMTCRSCEIRIAKHLMQIKAVEEVSVSAPRGRAILRSEHPIPYRSIERAITRAGYEIGETPWLERDPKVWLTAGVGLALVAVLAVLAQVTGLTQLTSGVGDLSKGGIVVALLLGLTAGVSTCMALVGGLVLALSASFQRSGERTGLSAMRPAVVFILGRVAGYAFFGMVLGALGASVRMPPLVTAVLMVGVAIVMTILGTRLTGLSPRIAGWSPTLPLGVSRSLGLGRTGGAYSDARAATMGGASFFLPCGFTQAVQIFALSTGSPLYGAALLGTFAVGTAPGLLALAGVPVVVPSGAKPHLMRFVGMVVLAFAFLNLNAGLELAGLDLPGLGIGSVAAAQPTSTLSADGSAQLLTTYQGAEGYSPANAVIYAGIPTTWTVVSKTVTTCAATMVIPAWGTGASLKIGPNVFNLPALKPGRIRYTCAMGMYSGSITVIERPTASLGSPAAG
ncbi:MAG TPA: sulfite exporter TauE/SafE family protein [Candidatus Limnocylindrales bacterium]|nr:sulfite exporter TauE/SafE family protein [Candidatus Limnocylindrales bacterium]